MNTPGGPGAVLILGEAGGLAAALVRRLEQERVPVAAAVDLSDSEVSAAIRGGSWRAVAVLSRDDVLTLRLTLLSAHLRPDLPLWVTMFDRTITRELEHVAPDVHVISPTELVADDLAQHCVAVAGNAAAGGWRGIRLVDDSLRLLVRAGTILVLLLLLDAAIGMVALHESVVDAFYFSTRSVATVGGEPGATRAPVWFKVVSAADVVLALLFVAIFTAALVRRLSGPRLTTIFGPRAAPSKGHVLLIGFGQVGFRLAQELRRRGVAVLGIERDPDAPCLRLAGRAGIPVAIGRGDDRETLERAGIRSCAAIAAVTSSDLVNVAVGLAADELSPEIPLVLRLGDGEVAAETDSLLHLGRICDVHKIAVDTLVRGLRQPFDAVGAPDVH